MSALVCLHNTPTRLDNPCVRRLAAKRRGNAEHVIITLKGHWAKFMLGYDHIQTGC